MFTHPLKKLILKKLDPKINEVIAEHEETKARMEDEYSQQVDALAQAHTGRINRLEEDTLNKF